MSIIIFEKNKIDLDYDNVTIIATDSTPDASAGQDFVNLLRNRRNDSGWGTGGSSDAGNTTLEFQMSDEHQITDLILVDHNFKSYSVQYWNGSAFVDFSTPISVSNNTATTTHHQFNEVGASIVKLTITGTMTPDQDKLLAQFIVTRRIGAFSTQPFIKKPRQERGRKVSRMLSGRANVTRSVGSFSCSLSFPAMKHANDWAIIEAMFDSFEGFLVWLCGGSTSEFFTDVQGFRLKDIYLMTCTNDLESEWNDGRFSSGQKIEINLAESRT